MRKLWRGRVKFQLATTWSARSRDKSTTWVHPVLSTTLSCHMFRFVQHLGHPRLSSGRLAEDVAFFFGLTRLLKVPGCRPFSPLVFFFSVVWRVALHVSNHQQTTQNTLNEKVTRQPSFQPIGTRCSQPEQRLSQCYGAAALFAMCYDSLRVVTTKALLASCFWGDPAYKCMSGLFLKVTAKVELKLKHFKTTQQLAQCMTGTQWFKLTRVSSPDVNTIWLFL